MSKTVKVAIPLLMAAVFLAYLVVSFFRLDPVECEVCVEFNGRRECRRASGVTERDATTTAINNACSLITSGRDDLIGCTQAPPVLVQCTPR